MEKVLAASIVLAASGGANTNADPNNIIFTIKNTKLFVSAVTLSERDNQNYQNFLARHLKDPCIGINKN